MAILGELPLSEGTITVKGEIGYASQQAWIYNGSLRQNILFGQEYDKDKLTAVIQACALDKVQTQNCIVLTSSFSLYKIPELTLYIVCELRRTHVMDRN